MKHKVSLKHDLKWKKVKDLQKIFRLSEIWEDFPLEGLKLIFAELQPGEESQRIDLLYINKKGGLYPCELKIGGDDMDTHGQLIRYISDLSDTEINIEWLLDLRRRYLINKSKKRSVP